MSAQAPRLERFTGIANAGILGLAVLVFLWRNLPNDAVWGDESDGIFRSLGYPAGDETRGLSDVLEGTRSTNDAGGFDVLLHWWMQGFGTSIVSLRLLPAVFFLAYLLGLLAVGRRMRAPWWLATAVVGVMLVENITPYYAVEIRPYAPELAATTVLLALALWLGARPTWPRAATYVVAVVVFLSHHYSGIAPAAAALAVLLVLGWRQRGKARWLALLPGLVGLVWLPVLYLALRGSPLGVERQRVWYLDLAMLRYADTEQWLAILRLNLLTPTTLPRTLFLIVVPMLWWMARRRGRGSLDAPVGLAWLFVLVGTGISALMSLAGFLPWYLGTRWSINDVGFIAISLMGLAVVLLAFVRRSPRWLISVAVLCSIAATLVGGLRLASYERQGVQGYLHVIGPQMLAGGPQSLTIDAWIYRDVQYLIDRSGAYEELVPGWRQVRDSVLLNPAPSEAADVEEFLASPRTRMLLRNVDPLAEVSVPANVQVVKVAGDRGPVLLVKP